MFDATGAMISASVIPYSAAACRKYVCVGTLHIHPMWMLFARIPCTPSSRARYFAATASVPFDTA